MQGAEDAACEQSETGGRTPEELGIPFQPPFPFQMGFFGLNAEQTFIYEEFFLCLWDSPAEMSCFYADNSIFANV